MSDVCLILEGTFPFVVGGVSAWVYDLIRGLPDLKFSVIHISPMPTTFRELKYEFPKNLVFFEETYLFDYQIEKRGSWSWRKRRAWKELARAYRDLLRGRMNAFPTLARWIHGGIDCPLNLHDFAHSEPTWKFILSQYHREKGHPSFIDYFWTWRLLHLPLIQLLRTPLPEASVYHAVSTGYAGFLASIARVRTQRPMLLTEHGIYTRERKMEIFQSSWIHSELPKSLAITTTRDFFRDWWIRTFSWMSRLTYTYADAILTLFERNRLLQIEEGAGASKTRVIPNGVVLSRLRNIPRPGGLHVPPRLLFFGRVVPIKDVKTFVKVIKELTVIWPNLEARIAGPTDEDVPYYQECEQLVRSLQLGQNIRFLGRVEAETVYAWPDLLVLTSISEAQPLVILEANACGIPVVATDVGACRELLEGAAPADRALGPSGLITPVGDVAALARSIRTLMENPVLYKRMAFAGRQRVNRSYRQEVLLAEYQSLYENAMEAQPPWPA